MVFSFSLSGKSLSFNFNLRSKTREETQTETPAKVLKTLFVIVPATLGQHKLMFLVAKYCISGLRPLTIIGWLNSRHHRSMMVMCLKEDITMCCSLKAACEFLLTCTHKSELREGFQSCGK